MVDDTISAEEMSTNFTFGWAPPCDRALPLAQAIERSVEFFLGVKRAKSKPDQDLELPNLRQAGEATNMKLKIHSLLLAVLAFALLPLSANAATVTYSFNLSGSQEVPTNSSTAAGSGQVTIDDVAGTLSFALAIFNLQGAPTAAHIHFAPVGVDGAVVFDLGANADAGGLITIGPISIPNSLALAGELKPIATELAALINASPSDYYVNVHSSAFPGGEVRGQLATAPVPLPAGFWLLGSALGLTMLGRRKA